MNLNIYINKYSIKICFPIGTGVRGKVSGFSKYILPPLSLPHLPLSLPLKLLFWITLNFE